MGDSSLAFDKLPLLPSLLHNLAQIGYTKMTEVQAHSLPPILAGKDVRAQAKTGSGKTAAFGLAILQQVQLQARQTQALVLCPTRELAEQVAEQIRILARTLENVKVLTLCGGAPMGPQISSLSHGAQVIVGTPGRIMDHLLKRRLDVSQLGILVLDEADRMLDMGFADELEAVIKATPTTRQTLLFSATYPDNIARLSQHVQRQPVVVNVQTTDDTRHIQQIFYEVDEQHKTNACAALLTHFQPGSAFVFCNTKIGCQQLADQLTLMGFAALALQGDMQQKERHQVLTRFANGSALVLVATDVAARGLDIEKVEIVINYQVSQDADTHTHRIGRTGRAGESGLALTLCAPAEACYANNIEQKLGTKLKWQGIQAMRFHANRIVQPKVQTLCIDGGKKAKLRPGDLLGALTQDAGIEADDIGKIKITATHSFIAIKIRSVKRALALFREGKIKGKKFKARRLA